MEVLILALPAAAALLGLALGLVGLLAPQRAAKIVRLQVDPAYPDGVAEFRASFGGLFVAVHGACLAALTLAAQSPIWMEVAAIACAMAALVWIGTALGRLVALALDQQTRTPYQAFAVGFEMLLGLMLAAPILWAAGVFTIA